jgi:hypothetical protein
MELSNAVVASVLEHRALVPGLEGRTVGDFWQWAYSDILSNRNRSVFAEFMVGVALKAVDKPRVEWNATDLCYRNCKIEVKASAYLQSWPQKNLSPIRYDFDKAIPWEGATGESQAERTRCSDLYVFCLYPEKEKGKANVLDVPAWRFYVVSTAKLSEKFGETKSLSLEAVGQMVGPCEFHELRDTVDEAVVSDSKVPGRGIWKPFEGQEYTVFIDESFYKFFEFTHDDGNFVHGAVGVPSARYGDLTQALAPTLDEYRRAYREFKGAEPNELKSADLYKLPFPIRRRLMLKLQATLAANGGFIAGFYTSNRGLVMEEIREDLIDNEGITAVPEDHAQLYNDAVVKLNKAATGPGMSERISALLSLPVMAMAHFFNALKCSFRVVYDPRHEEEDAAVKASVESLMSVLKNAETRLGISIKFSGLAIDRQSHEEIGLQIADIVAGEVRRFFRFNPDFLTSGSGLGLIRFVHEDGEAAILHEVDGRTFKIGRQVPIPPYLLRRAFKATEECSFPYFRNLLAAGMVTCITEFGTERDVALFDGVFLDLCD